MQTLGLEPQLKSDKGNIGFSNLDEYGLQIKEHL